MRRRSILTLTVLTGLTLTCLRASPAHAADDRFDGADWGWSMAAGVGGSAVGGGLALGASYLITRDDPSFGSLGVFLLLLPVGTAVGGTAGSWLYGDLSGHDTRWWAPVLGGAVGGGLGLAGFLGALGIDNDWAGGTLGLVSLFALPALGATTGYVLGLKDGGAQARWTPPSVLLLPDGAGGLRTQATLLNMRF